MITSAFEFETYTNKSLSGVDAGYAIVVLDMASEEAEKWCGGPFEPRDVLAERADSVVGLDGILVVRLRETPIISVTDVRLRIMDSESDISHEDGELDTVTGEVRVYWGRPLWLNAVTIVTVSDYRAGYDPLPEPVKMATALLAQEFFEMQGDLEPGSGTRYPLASYTIGSYSETYAVAKTAAGDPEIGLGTDLSRKALSLLRPYRRAGALAI